MEQEVEETKGDLYRKSNPESKIRRDCSQILRIGLETLWCGDGAARLRN